MSSTEWPTDWLSPGTMGQIQPILPYVTFVRPFSHSNRRSSETRVVFTSAHQGSLASKNRARYPEDVRDLVIEWINLSLCVFDFQALSIFVSLSLSSLFGRWEKQDSIHYKTLHRGLVWEQLVPTTHTHRVLIFLLSFGVCLFFFLIFHSRALWNTLNL